MPMSLARPRRALRAFVAATGLAAACSAVTASAQTVLTASSWVPPTHLLSETLKDWCSQLEEKTAAQVKCNLLPRAVGAPPATFDAIRNGLADVSFVVHGYTPARFVVTRVAELPFAGNSAESLSVAYQRLYARTPALQDEHKGVRVLAVFTHGPGMVFNTKRPIVSAADLTGLKFRVGGGIVNDIGKALDMNVTLKPSTESYELLSTGVMDGTLFPPESIEAFKIDKVVRYGTSFPGGLYNTSFAFLMHPAAYDRLTPAAKQAVDALSGEHAARLFGRAWDRADRRGMAFMQVSGVQFAKADEAFVKQVREKTAPVEREWAAAAAAKGLKDPARVLAELRSEAAKLGQ